MTVFANGKSILHKGHGKTQLAIAPDVCKTPSPGGPVPIPYPNMSADRNLTKGAETVTINGNPVANTDSQLSRSNGDEAGTAGGIMSSKNMGTFGWSAGSMDVEAEGKGVIRMLDPLLTNGNTYNDTGVTLGTPQVAYGDDAVCPRQECKLDWIIEKHRIPETLKVAGLCTDFAVECTKKVPKKIMERFPGRMVGVALCKCGQVFKAISGPELSNAKVKEMGMGFCNSVAGSGDTFLDVVTGANPKWKCAALKIMSEAGSSHTIVAMSEKWVGSPDGDKRTPKTFVKQDYTFPVKWGAGFYPLAKSRHDRRSGVKHDSLPSYASIPSCGKCQALLPAWVCEMPPCPGN